ncbi:YggS family pyridoxal phosphate-dependent enzyme [Facklamia sp. DSM 111018]|uniref:Pyridoxal phosphate homeostasis protein n=2 Tax=Bacilli TaxID=91061 RepID=A0ABS0LPF7_9LACT|nr:YggS family pyridoxal phosphate-dependent enzyme [Facklamia lactis]MBG9980220.1 YggS family pyridoxal phosphate-dependent enzyme [Facklamia lactis]MBG9986023.1 YggS family pyridoxal phosphate-dependent enzyme [Facklamia lactis]
MNEQILKQNLTNIQSKIGEKDVTLIAVTKFVDAETTRQVYQAGINNLAENRTDKFLQKKEALSNLAPDIKWHFIGHLQSRQVKLIINEVDYLHSLDRVSLAKEIQKRANHPVNCFLQVNISGEESKGGFEPSQVVTVIEDLAKYDKVVVIGLMTMAPIDASPVQLHEIFGELRNLQKEIASKKLSYAPCQELSMGMSRDYEIALEEGATFIRVGTAIYDEK